MINTHCYCLCNCCKWIATLIVIFYSGNSYGQLKNSTEYYKPKISAGLFFKSVLNKKDFLELYSFADYSNISRNSIYNSYTSIELKPTSFLSFSGFLNKTNYYAFNNPRVFSYSINFDGDSYAQALLSSIKSNVNLKNKANYKLPSYNTSVPNIKEPGLPNNFNPQNLASFSNPYSMPKTIDTTGTMPSLSLKDSIDDAKNIISNFQLPIALQMLLSVKKIALGKQVIDDSKITYSALPVKGSNISIQHKEFTVSYFRGNQFNDYNSPVLYGSNNYQNLNSVRFAFQQDERNSLHLQYLSYRNNSFNNEASFNFPVSKIINTGVSRQIGKYFTLHGDYSVLLNSSEIKLNQNNAFSGGVMVNITQTHTMFDISATGMQKNFTPVTYLATPYKNEYSVKVEQGLLQEKLTIGCIVYKQFADAGNYFGSQQINTKYSLTRNQTLMFNMNRFTLNNSMQTDLPYIKKNNQLSYSFMHTGSFKTGRKELTEVAGLSYMQSRSEGGFAVQSQSYYTGWVNCLYNLNKTFGLTTGAVYNFLQTASYSIKQYQIALGLQLRIKNCLVVEGSPALIFGHNYLQKLTVKSSIVCTVKKLNFSLYYLSEFINTASSYGLSNTYCLNNLNCMINYKF